MSKQREVSFHIFDTPFLDSENDGIPEMTTSKIFLDLMHFWI